VNLLAEFARRVDEHPGRIALIDPNGRSWTYRELDRRGQSLAAGFAERGLRAGDRVLIALGLGADLYATLAALWRIGAVAVLPEPALGLAGIKRAVETVEPAALLLGGFYRFLPLLVPPLRRIALRLRLRTSEATAPAIADLPPDAPALVSFTTGSTGPPKAIVRSHGFMRAQDAAVAPLIGTRGMHETDLVGFPVFVVANLGQGITSVLPDWPVRRMDKATGARIARLIERHRVTRLLLNPALVERLADAGIPRSVRAVFSGGGPVFPDLIRKLRAARPDIDFVAVYGSTEAEPIAEVAARDIAPEDLAAMESGHGLLAGAPVAGASVRLVDDEIQVAGGHVVQGYLDPARDAESKVRDGDGTLWHRTGDAGRFDEAGRLWLLGRLRNRVGEVWPFQAEVAARGWSGVRQAALVELDGQPAIAIEGDVAHLASWQQRGKALGLGAVLPVERMPMDKRHGSKIDMGALAEVVRRHEP
jgi:acyl-CoA synthetase (AMP-forming)/AMP-acid ligase II